ncbi:MAG: hypothetical protein ACM37W_15645 [Actinomycetota bacterium]
MNHLPLSSLPVTPHWDCPECNSTGSIQGEICPVCFGAKLINSPMAARWLLDFMESRGCLVAELEMLRKEDPDPLTFALCLGICSALQRADRSA